MDGWAQAAPFVPRLLQSRRPDDARHWQADATMVLVDISGFTTLSEQLARRGRVGAEDLVATLTRIFTLLLSATDDGGDVVKFAGDAMLIAYDGPDHELHACHAASAIQRLLGVVGSVRLAGARARLRMSVGIHTGRFEFLLTGEDHQGLVVTGPTLDALLSLQDAASPGQILVSPQVAAALPPSSTGDAVGGGLLLGRVPAIEAVGGAAQLPSYDGIAALLPRAFASRPDLLVADSDHRRCAVGFVQVTGLDALLAQGGVSTAVDNVTAVVERACLDNGVTLLDTDLARDGYRYFLVAGAPTSVEDPEGRLLRALTQITTSDGPLPVRAGAAAGQVFAGPVGAPFRRVWSAMGDTTNLAARLTSRAPEGSVLAHAPLLARAQTLFETTEHDPVQVKGKAEPLAVAVVVRAVGRRGRVDAELPFVGRRTELAVLAENHAAARDGSGGVVEVVGEAGLGKSRLAAESAARSGLPLLVVAADPYDAQVPYRLLARLVHLLLGDDLVEGLGRLSLPPDTARWLPLLGPALAIDLPGSAAVEGLDDRFRVARFHDLVRDLLTALLPDASVLLVDDAQWVDQSSADALTAALTVVADRPWSVVLTRREADTGLRGGDASLVVRLEALGGRAAHELVAGARSDLRPAEREAILGRADGNPYFLLELAGATGAGELPDTVEELVGLRIDALEAQERDLLRQAAVLGTRFPARLFEAVSGRTDLLVAARGAGLAPYLEVTDDQVAFRRELQREVAYEQLTFRRRRDVHRRAALALEAEPALAGGAWLPLLSLHGFQAGDWPDAYRHSRAAARAAQAAYANEEAATFCRRALEAGRRTDAPAAELRELHLSLGEVLALTGHHDEAVRAFTAARRGLDDPAEVARIVHKTGMVQQESTRFPAALRSARAVRSLVTALPAARRDELVVEADLLTAGVRYWQGRARDCQRIAREAVARAEGLPAGRTRTRLLARAYVLHDTAAIELEGRAGTYGERPLDMLAEIGDDYSRGRFAVNVAVGHFYEGRWARAVEMYRLSLEIAERIGDAFGAAVAQMNIGELLAYQGVADEAVELLKTSLVALRGLDNPIAAAHAACFLAVAHRTAGDLAAAGAGLDEAAALFTASGVTGFGPDELATRRLEVLVERGDLAAATALATSLLERDALAGPHRVRALRSRALVALARGDSAEAGEAAERSIDLARAQSLVYELALSLLVRDAVDTGKDESRSEAERLLASLGVVDVRAVTPRSR